MAPFRHPAQQRNLSDTDYVCVDRIRLEEAKAAVLVMTRVHADGTEEPVTMTDLHARIIPGGLGDLLREV